MLADLYELTMAASYRRLGMTGSATFSLFARHLPHDRGFLVSAGLQDALDILEDFAFDDDDLEWLRGAGFDEANCQALADVRFSGDVWAIPEGRVVLPDEPLVEVTASLPEAQLVETVVVNQLTYQTAIATKATRCRLGAADRAALVDFSFRRTHGIEAGIAAARACRIAGFAGTSNVEAARRFDLPAIGTMAHSYVQAFPEERSAFMAFAKHFPDRTTFLVDTYDTLVGVRTALEVASELDPRGPVGVRLDSGDLLTLSRETRRLLDQAGRPDISIVASGGLDEYSVAGLLDAGAPIDAFGVGTRVGVSADAPSLDSAYKLVEYDGRPVMKLSAGKETLPGPKQVYRPDGVDDLLATRTEPGPQGTAPLLAPVMERGRRLAPREPLGAARDRLTADLALLPDSAKVLRDPVAPTVRRSDALRALYGRVRRQHVTG